MELVYEKFFGVDFQEGLRQDFIQQDFECVDAYSTFLKSFHSLQERISMPLFLF